MKIQRNGGWVLIKYIFAAVVFLLIGQATPLAAETQPDPVSGPLGSKPLQLSFGPGGVTLKSERYICDLDAMNGHYSEWGETEQDARGLVMQACTQKSGLLLCKKDKITCRHDK